MEPKQYLNHHTIHTKSFIKFSLKEIKMTLSVILEARLLQGRGSALAAILLRA